MPSYWDAWLGHLLQRVLDIQHAREAQNDDLHSLMAKDQGRKPRQSPTGSRSRRHSRPRSRSARHPSLGTRTHPRRQEHDFGSDGWDASFRSLLKRDTAGTPQEQGLPGLLLLLPRLLHDPLQPCTAKVRHRHKETGMTPPLRPTRPTVNNDFLENLENQARHHPLRIARPRQ